MEKKDRDETQAEAEGDTPPARPKRGKRKHRGLGFAGAFSLVVAGLVFFVLVLALSGRTLPVPEIARAKLEETLNARLDGAPLRLGAMEVGVDRNGVLQLLMNNIRLADAAGGAVAQLNWLGAELSVERLLRREFAAERVYLTGAQITIRRTASGRFTVAAGNALAGEEQSVTEALARVDEWMTTGALASLSEVVAGGVVLTLEDARSGRIWQATNAAATLRKTGDSLSLSVTSDVFNGTDSLARMQVSLIRSRATGHVQFGVVVNDMPAADIALQSPVLSWLGVLDAPISGAVRTELDETGMLASFAGTLDIADGALRPADNVPPVAFDAAKAYFTFDPARQKIDFSQISVAAEDGRGIATGHAYLTEFEGLWPSAYLGQFQVEDLQYNDSDTFDAPVSLTGVTADLRVRLDPFAIEFGQATVDNDGIPVVAAGRVSADDAGWHVALDATTPRIDAERVLELWPRPVSPITRGWLSRNLKSGLLRRPALSLRFDSGQKPDVSLSFEFEDGVTRFLPEMPELTGVAGRAELQDYRFSLALEAGEITGPFGGIIDASNSAFTVLDTRPKPSMGQIDVAAKGQLNEVLGVLNNRPLRLMDRAKRPVDIAEATVTGTARITLPLKDGIQADEVGYSVAAELGDVSSESLVPGRVFASQALSLRASPEVVTLWGAARLDGVPLTANWRQPLGAGSREGGAVTGRVTLSQETLSAFDVGLPSDLLGGEAAADYELRLPADPDVPPQLELRSDLAGLSMGLEAVGWQKPPSQPGQFTFKARLGEVPEVEELALETAGLAFDGDLEIDATGQMESARFRDLRIGDWLDAEVELVPSPDGGAPTITVVGGTMDLRQLNLGQGGGDGGGQTGPINLRLDRLTVSDGIALAPLRGRIETTPRGLSGVFEARLNGGAPVQGTLTPANAGTSVRITSSNAAGVLRDAGLTPNAREGSLDLILTPVSDAPSGTFDGQFLIEGIRLRDAPAMAELLDAISVVGLIDQLGGAGIRFDTVDGQFRLNRRQLRLVRAAAVGPSIGISADGIYDLQSDRMDFQGVVSPVYFLNGIGAILTRRGEGLFGFNYRMAGPAAGPSVRVNPLSILTPGAFRELFRRAPPGG